LIQCTDSTSRVAVMGGAYGNAPALLACLEDARLRKCSRIAFLGDAIGCCGHSDQTLDLLRRHVDVFVAGNHEQQAAAGESTCGCNYADPRDEMIGCQAFELALKSLGRANQEWVRTWPAKQVLDFAGGRVLLCHGSPDQTSEFLFESQLDDQRLEAWLDRHDAKVLACTHTGLPWIRHLDGGRLALNCGVVGKPDHDGEGKSWTFTTMRCNGRSSFDRSAFRRFSSPRF
jgi:diadenosine tetraphosphatase ApaH/serine/threonine PP2A family protein phosphatase